MAQITWVGAGNGDWTTGADWSGGMAPGPADDVTIAVPGATVTVSKGTQIVNSLTTTTSMLGVTGGTLEIDNYAGLYGSYMQSGGMLLLQGNGATFYNSVSLSAGTINSQARQLVSRGAFNQTGGLISLAGMGGEFDGSLNQTGGTIRVQSGALDLYGTNTSLAGTISGAGSLVIAGNYNGLGGTTTLASGVQLKIAKVSALSGTLALAQSARSYTLTYGGYFYTAGQATVSLNHNTLALTGRAQLAGDFTGGTITASGHGQLNGLLLDNSSVLNITSSVNQTGPVTLHAGSMIDIASSGTLRMVGNQTIYDSSADGLLSNAGVLTKTAGAGTAEILTTYEDTKAAIIDVQIGEIDFSGSNTNDFNGQASGAGTLSLGAHGGAQINIFESNFGLNTAGFVLTGQLSTVLTLTTGFTFAGSWDQSGGLLLLAPTGKAITLTLDGPTILDGGVIKTSKSTIDLKDRVNFGNNPSYALGVDIEGFTKVTIENDVYQNASMQLGVQSGSLPVATIESGASWFIEDGSDILGPYGKINVVSGGTLAKIDGAGASSIDGTLQLAAGALLEVAASSVVLDGSGTLQGTVSGNGQLVLAGNGIYELGTTLALSTGSVLIDNTPQGPQASVVSLDSNLSYSGIWGQHGGSLELNGNTLTLTGTTALDGGTIIGPGTITSSGLTTLGGDPGRALNITGLAVVDVTGASEQSGDITVGNSGQLDVISGATLTQDDSFNILGNGTLTIAGAFQDNGSSLGSITASVVDTGAITVGRGELAFLGGVSGAGSLAVGSGARLDLDGAVNTTLIGMSAGNADVLLGDASAFAGTFSGFVTGDFIEISALQTGTITTKLDQTDKLLTISDSAQHTFTLAFAQALNPNSLLVADGPHGYIGVYHT